MKVKDIFKATKARLVKANIENPELNVGLILEEITGYKRLSLVLHFDEDLSKEQIEDINIIVERRCLHEPLQHIFGYTEFYGSRLIVSPAVLIPRPETEYLIEIINTHIIAPKKIIDIGTGSGAIAISLKKIFPNAEVFALDISPQALKIAKENAINNQVDINFVEGDILTDNLGFFDVIVSNPPYISQEEYEILPLEVKNYEPKLALVGSDKGLYFYKKILNLAHHHLEAGGSIFFEIGEEQAKDIRRIALSEHFNHISVIKDLVGRDRIIHIKPE